MVKHIILWDHGDNFTPEEKRKNAENIKAGLEGLRGVIPGLVKINVYTQMMEGSNAELVLDSTFENKAALEGYQVHPAHVKVATEIVRPHVKNRRCADFDDGE